MNAKFAVHRAFDGRELGTKFIFLTRGTILIWKFENLFPMLVIKNKQQEASYLLT